MDKNTRHGTSQGRKPHGRVEPKPMAKPNNDAKGPKGKGQMNEGEPRWSGDPKKVD